MFIDRPVGLSQMLDAAKEAVFLARNRQKSDLETNKLLAISMVECLAIFGEAADRIPKQRQEELSQIPWQKIINIRNYLNQTELDINLDIVWEIVTKDLPLWIDKIDLVLATESKVLSE